MVKYFHRRIYAKEYEKLNGNVFLRQNGEVFCREDFYLEDAHEEFFLDFSNPVDDISSFRNTIPEGEDCATFLLNIPRDGKYKLSFRYNNPGFNWSGHRNIRDERNCRITIDSNNPLEENGWLGWMIFNVSGYNDSAMENMKQNEQTVVGNKQWNINELNCYLTAGEHELTICIQAPPGQAVYDGPNLNWIEIMEISPHYLKETDIPVTRKSFAFKHPGIFHTKEEFMQLKESIHSDNPLYIKGFQQIKQSQLGSLDYQPNAVDKIEVGPYNNPNHGGKEWTQDCTASYYHALLWYITGELSHAEKSISILSSWSTQLKDVAPGNDLKLRFSLMGIEMVAAAEILKHVYNLDSNIPDEKKWQDSDIKQFNKFLQTKIVAKTKEFYPQANGNWDALIGSFNMAAAIFLDDVELFNHCLRQYSIGDAVTKNCLSMGALPNYVYPTGELQESNRDQVHARMGLTGLALQAHIAKRQGIDLFTLYNHRLLKGYRYNATYQLGKKVQSNTFISDRGRGVADISTLGYEIMIKEYGKEKGDPVIELLNKVTNTCLRIEETKNEANEAAGFVGAFIFQVE